MVNTICYRKGDRAMNKEKTKEYAELLLSAYQNGILKIIWSESGFSMMIDPKRKDMFSQVKEDDFVDYAFSIIKMVIDLAEEREIDEKNADKLEVAKIIFDKEQDLKNHLYIKRNSKIDCFKLLEYEIISHRSKENPINIEASSAILNMVVDEKNNEATYIFEVSRRDLEDIINKLIELKEKIDTI